MKGQSIGFLLGAGVSIPCDAPSAAQLTAALMQPQIPYFRHTDGRYYPSTGALVVHHPYGVAPLSRIRDFLADLHDRVSSYYAGRANPAGCSVRPVNYEDLAYLAVQVSEGINRERDNPALTPFIDELTNSFGPRDALRELADETIGLIADHVAHSLHMLKHSASHLSCLRDACLTNGEGAIPILTLNNDCLIEPVLVEAGISMNDMTSLQNDGRRVVQVVPSTVGVNLFKLHGSIDWFRWIPEDPSEKEAFWGEWVGCLPRTNQRWPWISEGRPIMLVGRFNKELSYLSSPFSELFSSARASLNHVSRLVVSGYSFGDKAVNTMLVEWVYAKPKGARRLIVAHADPASLRSGARGAIGNKWDKWKDEGVLVEVPTYLGDLAWTEVHDLIVQ